MRWFTFLQRSLLDLRAMAEAVDGKVRRAYSVPFPDLKALQHDNLSILSEYGLGYGVDVTEDYARRSIIRQAVGLSEVKQRVEPAAFKYYYRKIVSGSEIGLKGTTMLAADLATAGVGLDLSRGTSRATVEVGSRIHTRTIHFDTVACRHFEDSLRKNVNFDAVHDDEDKLLENCKKFVKRCQCTHYIKAIVLGAVEHEFLTKEGCETTYRLSGNIEARVQHVGLGASSRFRKVMEKRRVEHQYTKIGSWDKDHHVLEEKVIDIEIAPIHKLIGTKQLKKAFKYAVKDYKKKKEMKPFFIKCESDDVTHYWKEKGGRITTTTAISEATKFCVDIIEHPNVISLETFKEKGPTKRLTYSVSLSGTSHRATPPALRPNSDTYEQRLTLKNPKKRKGNRANPNHWISEKELYLYIRCVNRFGVDGKFCMKMTDGDFQLTIVPKTREHNDYDVLMLFCIEKVPKGMLAIADD